MKQLFYKHAFYVAFILLSINAFSQNGAGKEIKDKFPLTDSGALYLSNKYGDIFINGWDQDFIEIQTDIEVKGKSLEKANALLKRISTNIVNTKNQVIVKSQINEKETSFFNKYFNKIDPFKNEKANTSINYVINLPRHAEIEVFNKYGDIIISDYNGKLIADSEHGDIRITDSITNSKFFIKYGKLKANILKETNITAKDAMISFDNSEVLKLESNGSEVYIETVKKLDINSNKDDIEINTINNIYGQLKFSKIVLNTVKSKLNLDLNLAELRVLKLDTDSPIVSLNEKSSEVYMNISNTNFNFGAKLEQGVLRIPKSMHSITSDVLDKKNKVRQIRAVHGTINKGDFDIKGYKGIIIFKEL